MRGSQFFTQGGPATRRAGRPISKTNARARVQQPRFCQSLPSDKGSQESQSAKICQGAYATTKECWQSVLAFAFSSFFWLVFVACSCLLVMFVFCRTRLEELQSLCPRALQRSDKSSSEVRYVSVCFWFLRVACFFHALFWFGFLFLCFLAVFLFLLDAV